MRMQVVLTIPDGDADYVVPIASRAMMRGDPVQVCIVDLCAFSANVSAVRWVADEGEEVPGPGPDKADILRADLQAHGIPGA